VLEQIEGEALHWADALLNVDLTTISNFYNRMLIVKSSNLPG